MSNKGWRGPDLYFAIWAAIPIALPSAITGWFLLMGNKSLSAGRLCTRKQAAPHDTLVIRVFAALRAACSSTRLRAHSPVWIPCQPAPFREHCSDPPITCSEPQSQEALVAA